MTDLVRLNAALGDRYAVKWELGSDGPATVYLAEDLKQWRPVALKVMKPEVAHEMGAGRFLREIEIAALLHHPNILPIFDSGEADGLLYFVVPHVERDTLRDRLEREGALPVEEAVRIAGEVGDALGYAHGRGLVHMDVRPENILFEEERALVSDFGVARALSATGTRGMSGLSVGSLAYVSPEQAAGDTDVDTRSDVYSLGCVLYEMISGSPPFAGKGDRALLACKLTEAPPSLEGAGEDVPVTVRDVVRKALESDRGDRYPSPGELAEALRRALAGTRVTAATRRRRRARELRSTAIVAAALLLGTVIWWVSAVMDRPSIGYVAVLPLQNAADDPDQDFLVAGLHVKLIQELARADVRVISPTSVLPYQDSERPANEVARELGVDAVIQGSTALGGDSVTLDLQLTDGGSDELLWSGSFGALLGDVPGLITEATRIIAGRVGVRLSDEGDEPLASAPQVSPEAYEALLRARFHRNRRSEIDLATALDDYEAVLGRDPDNAEALAGIAAVWQARARSGFVSAEEARERREAALRRAMELDSTLAEVQGMMAGLRTWGAWDWTGGERSFRQALAADPSDSAARAQYSQLLHILGRDDEATAQIDRAVRDDPFNPQVRTPQAMGLIYLREYEDAEEVLSDVLSRTPDYEMALSTLRTTYHLMGRNEEALEMWRASSAEDPEALVALDRGFAEGGYPGALRSLAELWTARSGMMRITPWQIGVLYAQAGERELALDYLERAFEEHDGNIPYLSVDPTFENLRDVPRLRDLIRRLGLPE
jgi:TolB-like protein/tetratricopeptide (TPR) repeat protein